jgi:hypothetical protein
MAALTLTVAVLSDLHAYDEAILPPSHLNIADAEDQPGKHPIAGLLELIQREELVADVVLTPGDLGDRARPAAIQYAWKALHRVGDALRAKLVAGTPGNRDLDSTHAYNSYDAKGVLQALEPLFPLHDEVACDRFWSLHFVDIEGEQFRLFLLNSCACHGAADNEIKHGRISVHTLERLKVRLAQLTPETVNLLMCHIIHNRTWS